MQDEPNTTPDESLAEVLRRAFRHGKRSQAYFYLWSFPEIEAQLQTDWLMCGETAEWSDVREAVQQGFEHESLRAGERLS